MAPAHAPRTPRSTSSRYLREDERIHIADRLREKATVRAIAAELGRSPSTISREIRRNGILLRKDSPRRVYRPYAAQSRADARRPRPKPGKIGQSPELRDFVQDHLTRRWSPEQICHALRRQFPDRPEMHVTHETVYQALYVQGRGELRRELTKALRTGRARRRPHRQSNKRQPRAIKNMVMISDRPAEADDRAVPGHWEGDLIVGTESRTAIGTLVERTTRYVMLVHLPIDHTAPNTRDALVETVKTLPAHLRRSLTWDQGSEMAAPGIHPRHRHPCLLLQPGEPLAARIEREHQRPAPPVLPQGHRPLPPHPRRTSRRGRRTEQPPAQNARLGNPSRASV